MLRQNLLTLVPSEAFPYPRTIVQTWALIAGTRTWMLIATEPFQPEVQARAAIPFRN